jgi:hypothetical protein
MKARCGGFASRVMNGKPQFHAGFLEKAVLFAAN